ncbi:MULTISPECIES: hypothetical protein [unclassified Bradyrhizobium]
MHLEDEGDQSIGSRDRAVACLTSSIAEAGKNAQARASGLVDKRPAMGVSAPRCCQAVLKDGGGHAAELLIEAIFTREFKAGGGARFLASRY